MTTETETIKIQKALDSSQKWREKVKVLLLTGGLLARSPFDGRHTMKVRDVRWWFAAFLVVTFLLSVGAQAAQKDFQRLTVGYTPISGAAIPFFIAVEEKIFQKYGFEVAPVFMGGSPLINSAILAGEFPIGYTGGGAIISSRLAGSDLIAIASPLPVLTIDGWAKPEIKSVSDLRGKRVGVTRLARRVISRGSRC